MSYHLFTKYLGLLLLFVNYILSFKYKYELTFNNIIYWVIKVKIIIFKM